MKTIGIKAFAAAVVCGLAFALSAEVSASLAEAQTKIATAIENPSELTSVIGGLSAADQLAFYDAVNEAIRSQPGSEEERIAKYLAAARAALKGSKDNAVKMMTEVFATVPPEALVVVNEDFAANVINRWADSNRRVTDAQYLSICTNLLTNVIERVKTAEGNPSVRTAFAILMLERASQGSADGRSTTGADGAVDAGTGSGTTGGIAWSLVGLIPNSREAGLARSSWLPAALGYDASGNPVEQSYAPILGYTGAKIPDYSGINRMTMKMQNDYMLMLLANGDRNLARKMVDGFGDISRGEDRDLWRIPRTPLEQYDWWSGRGRGDRKPRKPEPEPYDGQTL